MKPIERVWAAIQTCFPTQSEAYGPVDGALAAQWAHALKDYDVSRGIQRMLSGGGQYPPSLPEFIELCSSRPEWTPPPDAEETAARARKMLSGGFKRDRHRIIPRGDVYVHQIQKDGKWVDNHVGLLAKDEGRSPR